MDEKVEIPAAKRAFDVITSFFLLILLSPVFLIIIFLILAESLISPSSGGGIFYSEIRVSRGRPFRHYKFRIFPGSVLESAKRGGGVIQTKELEKNPENMTRIGQLLRRAYLDELPQLWNILRSDMSMVGPRPTNPVNYERGLGKGNRAKRLIRAGLAGPYQTYKGRNLTRDQETLDMEYVQFVRNSAGWKVVLFDMKIILMSVITVLRAEGI